MITIYKRIIVLLYVHDYFQTTEGQWVFDNAESEIGFMSFTDSYSYTCAAPRLTGPYRRLYWQQRPRIALALSWLSLSFTEPLGSANHHENIPIQLWPP